MGYDNFDLRAATARGIMMTNTPGVLTETTADLAFTLLMAVARRIVESALFVKRGHWKTWGPRLLLGQDICGATLGLVGLGRIGLAVARRAKGFDMDVLYCDIGRNEAAERELGLKFTDLENLLSQADFVSLHVPLTPATKHMINRQSLKRMKRTAVLINTARGAVVDEEALYQALQSGELAGAGLDVTDPEPMELSNKLLSLENVVVVPHIASASVKTRNRMAMMAAENMIAGLYSRRPPNILNPEVCPNFNS
ncbi:MAG: Glyoxylate/hydroxypyruvate reductase B [Firmicutes bacterium]|nr:Glyoxylate/hydroxypyruvate reductase B [candidate division NPL-UPA2 bacterium]